MSSQRFDVFISYRRGTDAELARLVKDGLEKRGLKVFLDVEDLQAGRFDTALLDRIARTPDFVIILTSRTLDGRPVEDDWLARELGQALKTERNVVPLASVDFPLPIPPDAPAPWASLSRLHFAAYDHRFRGESMARLHRMLKSPRRRRARVLGRAFAGLAALAVIFALVWPRGTQVFSSGAVPHSSAALFKSQRPPGGGGAGDAPVYRLEAPLVPDSATGTGSLPAAAAGDWLLGVTALRLRRATPEDGSDVRLLVQDGGEASEWIPVRTESGTPLAEGERVRLMVESGRAGYLYVIDREQYAGGGLGEPFLIFPTLRTRGGDNAVAPGRVVDIPSWHDTPPFFRLQRSRADQIGEVLTFLLVTEPLPDLPIGRLPLRLTGDQVQRWEREWGGPVERIEMVGGAGRSHSGAERGAGEDRPRLLRQEDPLPQTIFRAAAGPGHALLVSLPLPIQ